MTLYKNINFITLNMTNASLISFTYSVQINPTYAFFSVTLLMCLLNTLNFALSCLIEV